MWWWRARRKWEPRKIDSVAAGEALEREVGSERNACLSIKTSIMEDRQMEGRRTITPTVVFSDVDKGLVRWKRARQKWTQAKSLPPNGDHVEFGGEWAERDVACTASPRPLAMP